MKHDFHHGKVLSFHRSGDELRSKASFAERDDDVLHALQLYRTALEQDQDDLLTGIAYARLLWENGCWRSSLRECWRLLGRYPEEEKLYGLIYRNLLALGEDRSACAAYERYMLHLYHNPDQGLNLNEVEPPIPEKPPRARYHRLLGRIHRLMEKGDIDRANRLLCHAERSIFPADDPVRELLEIQLMVMTGLTEEAVQMAEGLLDRGRLNASQALALIPLLQPLADHDFIAGLLLYATSVAQTPQEVYDTVRECLRCRQPRLAHDTLYTAMDEREQPLRLDCQYDLAVAALYAGELDTARKYLRICYQTDPMDSNVDYLYRLLDEVHRMQLAPEDYPRLPVTLYGAEKPACIGLLREKYEELLRDADKAEEHLHLWSEMNLLMDCIAWLPELHEKLFTFSGRMVPRDRSAFLRMLLLCANPSKDLTRRILDRLRAGGNKGDVAYIRSGVLVIEPLQQDEPKEAEAHE